MDDNKSPNGKIIAKRVEQFIKMRNKRRELKKDYVALDLPFAEMENKLSAQIMDHIQSLGVQSAKTEFGTAYLSHKTSASLADPDAFMRFVIDNQRFELLDRKANAKAIEDYIGEHDCQPPGVNFAVVQTLRVNSPSSGKTNGATNDE